MSDISKFISLFEKGQAMANRYEVEFTLPAGVPNGTSGVHMRSTTSRISAIQRQFNGIGQVNILCHSCTMPMRSVMTYELRQLNAPFRVPYSQTYDPVSFMFYADSSMFVRQYFDVWQQAVINIKNNTLNFRNEYTADIVIKQLNREGKASYAVKLYEAFPIAVTSMEYAYANSQVQNVSCSIAYKYWEEIAV